MTRAMRTTIAGSELAPGALRSSWRPGLSGPGLVPAIALVGLTFASVASSAEVRLRSSAVCTGSIVRLADVAEVFADDRRLAQALAETPLCPAPQGGHPRSLSQHDLRQILLVSGVEKSVAVTGSEAVSISSESAGHASTLPKRSIVASGVRQAAFEAEAETNQKAPSRAKPRQPSPPVDDDKPSSSAPLIDKGAIVAVHALAAGIRISTSGKALEAGASGETIPVELADTKQRVQARIVGPGTVEIAASSAVSTRP
jgi:flagella basal body P-ring formation protein FlgA